MSDVKIEGSFGEFDLNNLIGDLDVEAECKNCGHELIFKIKDIQQKPEVICPKCNSIIPVKFEIE